MRATPRSLAVILWSLVALAPLGAGACHVGDAGADDDAPADGSGDDDGTTGPDASTDDGTDDGADDGTDDGADDGGAVDVTACRELVTDGVVTGHHPARFDYNDGEQKGCVQDACHGASPGPAAPVYTIGGTVFESLTAGQPVGGATVYVTDLNGTAKALVTDSNGFFWSSEALTPPFEVAVTAGDCPTEPLKMVSGAIGNCNSGGCHDADYQIYSEL